MLMNRNRSTEGSTERRNMRLHWGINLDIGSDETPRPTSGQVHQEEYRSESYPLPAQERNGRRVPTQDDEAIRRIVQDTLMESWNGKQQVPKLEKTH